MKGCLFNIQKFSLHDGPGIRSVVFFKGCPLRCKWCANPESLSSKIQVLWDKTKCTQCFQCVNQCKAQNIHFTNQRIVVDAYDENEDYTLLCPQGALKKEGGFFTVDEVMQEVMKDKPFYEESKGGVTLSGGEVLQQASFAKELISALKKENIHVAAETTGFTSKEIFISFIEQLDLLLYDMKHYDSQKHQEACGVPNTQCIENMKIAVQSNVDVIARIPVIPGFNNSLEDARKFSEVLKEIGITKVNLLPFHQFGMKKYELLGLDYAMKNVKQLHPEDLYDYQKVMLDAGLDCYF